ncbi:MFS transporter [Nocardiopsis sp. JB363]|uniref:MFS transporter n=1 Tax=Nocardiopsis sp. JB363 TaxID=1434837 RepID=UPI00097AF22F|nr:MFS transporter [Nocardiopsis sp. JB363]SIO90370.1 major facilitator superfamily MFS_1 [Nocardiopsis sp. JB363]
MKLLAPLRLPRFRRLYTAQIVANVGDGLDYLAIITLVVFLWDRGAGSLSALALALALPLVIGAPFFGAVADRFEPRVVMVGANVLRGLAFAGIAMSAGFAQVLLLVAVTALGTGLFNTAQVRFIRSQVSDDLLLSANALRSTTERMLTGMAGPALAAGLIGLYGPRTTLVVTAVCFAVSGLLVARVGRVDGKGDSAARAKRQPLHQRVVVGFAHVWSLPPLRLVVFGMAGAYLITAMFDVMLPLWYREIGGGPAFIGIAMTCLGAGGAVGAVLTAQFGDRFNLITVMAGAAMVIGVLVGGMGAVGVFGASVQTALWFPAIVVIGAAAATAIVGYSTLVQRLTPEHMMGRVAAITGAALTVPTVLGPALAPLLTLFTGIDGLFILCGSGLLAIGAFIALRSRRYSALVRPEPAADRDDGNESDGGPRSTAASTNSAKTERGTDG